MPPKKKGRTTKAKPKIVSLSPEDQQLRDQCNLLLKDFDKQCENTVKEAWREVDTVSKSINTLYKLELLKMPQEVKDMKWDDYYQQSMDKGENPLALSEAVEGLINDSICASVDSQVSQLRSAMKSTKKKTATKKKAENQPASAVRASSRKKAMSDNQGTGINTATRSSSRSRTRGIDESNSAMATPANTRMPPNMGKTPLITPKFDTSSLSRTVSRVAKANEVLVSLSGSPVVMPAQTKKSKAAPAEEVAQVTLAAVGTLNVPLVEDGGVDTAYLDDEQLDKLDALQKSLANMVRARREADYGSGEGEN